MSWDAFKPRVVWSDTGEKFRIVQRRHDNGETYNEEKEAREFPSASIYVVEKTTRRDAMGAPVWEEVIDGSKMLIYAIARDWTRVAQTMQQMQAKLDERRVTDHTMPRGPT